MVVGKGISLIRVFEEVVVLSYHASITWNDFKASKYTTKHVGWCWMLKIHQLFWTKVSNIFLVLASCKHEEYFFDGKLEIQSTCHEMKLILLLHFHYIRLSLLHLTKISNVCNLALLLVCFMKYRNSYNEVN